MLTDEQYYDSSNSDEWGNYQYTTLEEIVNNYMMSLSPDDVTSMVPRYQVLYHARRGLREFYYDVLREVKGISLDLSSTLQVTLPPDFVNYVRISWVDSAGCMHVMAVDDTIPMAKVYLQDNNYQLLFDEDGAVLQASQIPPAPTAAFTPSTDLGSLTGYVYEFSTFQPNKDMSRVFVNGKYRVDKTAGIIQFSSDVQGRSVVLEYISDGLYSGTEGIEEGKQKVNKFAEDALYNYIYYNLIKQLRNVPAVEKQRAKKEYYNSRRIAKMRLSTLRKSELLQVFKGDSKWIK